MPSLGLEQHGQLATGAASEPELELVRGAPLRAACDDRATAPDPGQLDYDAAADQLEREHVLERGVRDYLPCETTDRVHAHCRQLLRRRTGPEHRPRRHTLQQPSWRALTCTQNMRSRKLALS